MTCVDVVTVTGNEMYACAFLCFKKFSVLISTMVNTDRLNLHKQKLFGTLSFYGRKGVLKQKSLENHFCKIVHSVPVLQEACIELVSTQFKTAAPAGEEGP